MCCLFSFLSEICYLPILKRLITNPIEGASMNSNTQSIETKRKHFATHNLIDSVESVWFEWNRRTLLLLLTHQRINFIVLTHYQQQQRPTNMKSTVFFVFSPSLMNFSKVFDDFCDFHFLDHTTFVRKRMGIRCFVRFRFIWNTMKGITFRTNRLFH